MSLKGNLLVGQAGGPSSVINSSLYGVIEEAKKYDQITGIFGTIHGIEGILEEDLIDLKAQSQEDIEGLKRTPGAALRACRYMLKSSEPDDDDIMRVYEVFRKYNIRYFIYNGGNDSMDTANKIYKAAELMEYDIRVMGVPKTVDNDLEGTDYCPGNGSSAKYLATLVRESALHNESMYTSEPITVLVTVGRNAGWLPAACALANNGKDEAPHIICFPEVPFDKDSFVNKVKKVYDTVGGVFIITGEGLTDKHGSYVMVKSGDVATDPFGHPELGAVGDYLKNLLEERLKLKTRVIVPDISQQAAMHWASATDIEYGELAGRTAVSAAIEGFSGFMPSIRVGKDNTTYNELVELETVANAERRVPDSYINREGTFVTDDFINYIAPFIQGDVKLPMENGLPVYTRLKRIPVVCK
ncbi:MAG TPA: 6-phosphofructokinase [Clostridia bacterium]|nr:6-phosphofructokinase [Clostridia bacterium]